MTNSYSMINRASKFDRSNRTIMEDVFITRYGFILLCVQIAADVSMAVINIPWSWQLIQSAATGLVDSVSLHHNC